MTNANAVPQVPPAERIQTSYKQLTLAATHLNAASDELGQAIAILDVALQRLNIGVSAWVRLSGDEDPQDGNWWHRDVGYTKARSKWGIALRDCEGNYTFPDHDREEVWPFNEAPRWMRIEAVNKMPDLLDALLKETEETTKKIKKKTVTAQQLAVAINKAVEESRSAKAGK
jgi:hypothetical protein